MSVLPTKTTLDEMEQFGSFFKNYFYNIYNNVCFSYSLASTYIIISESEVDGEMVPEWHPNMAIYSEVEKQKILDYWNFLKSSKSFLEATYTSHGMHIEQVFNVKAKLDYLISNKLGDVMTGSYEKTKPNSEPPVETPVAEPETPLTDVEVTDETNTAT